MSLDLKNPSLTPCAPSDDPPRRSPGSSIVNMASTQAFTPSGGIIDYAASKGA